MDGLEAREVPAALAWIGTADPGNFDAPTNWWNLDTQSLAVFAPAAGDDLYFDGNVSSANCNNMHAAGPVAPPPGGGAFFSSMSMSGFGLTPGGGNYNSVNLINNYTGTVTFTSDIGTAIYVQTSGSIAQPTSDTDLTVTSAFNWTGGTLNSSNHCSLVTFDGATATITPTNGGTVHMGSSIVLTNGAMATLREGTINIINEDMEFNVYSNCILLVDPNTGTQKTEITGNVQSGAEMKIAAGGAVRVVSGVFVQKGACSVNGGTFTISSGTKAYFSGTANAIGFGQASGTTYLYGSGKLIAGTHPQVSTGVALLGGELVVTGAGHSLETRALIESDNVFISGGITISFSNGPGAFGTLGITGDVTWNGGTFKPRTQGYITTGLFVADSDRLYITGTLAISQNATIDPIPLDSDGSAINTAAPDTFWLLIEAEGGVTVANNTQGLVDQSVYRLFTNPNTKVYLQAK